MSGIAELLINLGYKVSGSDLKESATTRRLGRIGGDIHTGHREEWAEGADVVVTSSAIDGENVEVQAARRQGVPIIQRAEMLAELMRLKSYGIAIAGSHGKTSTTSMVSWLLFNAGLDPTVVVGGKVDSLGGNAKLGQGEFLVAEADESDGSFLKLSPVIEVVTNIDLEHLDYYDDIDQIKEAFLRFIDKVPFYGAVILCLDDRHVADILPAIEKRTLTYGLTRQADVYAEKVYFEGGRGHCTVMRHDEVLGEISIAPPGKHNIYNALAAACVGLELEIPFGRIKAALESYEGVQRRMQVKGEAAGITVVDDYGHHPTEIRATLDAIKEAWPEKRLVVVFQPHRYSRTAALYDDFQTCFHQADYLVMTSIYAASEHPIDGISGERLLEDIRQHGQRYTLYVEGVGEVPEEISEILEPGDLVLTLGAGNIVEAGENLLKRLQNR